MATRWTEDDHEKLVVAIIATMIDTGINVNEVARLLKAQGIERTPKALSHKVAAWKVKAREVIAAADGVSPPKATARAKRKADVKTKDGDANGDEESPTKKAKAKPRTPRKKKEVKEVKAEANDVKDEVKMENGEDGGEESGTEKGVAA